MVSSICPSSSFILTIEKVGTSDSAIVSNPKVNPDVSLKFNENSVDGSGRDGFGMQDLCSLKGPHLA